VKFISRFDRIVVITQRCKLGQSISRVTAQVTGTWFKDATLDDGQIKSLLPLVALNLAGYFNEESFILLVGKVLTMPLLHIKVLIS
jgi:hypothetical protein